MTPDDLAAACERLRRVKDGEDLLEVYKPPASDLATMYSSANRSVAFDMHVLADAYLALAERDRRIHKLCVETRQRITDHPHAHNLARAILAELDKET